MGVAGGNGRKEESAIKNEGDDMWSIEYEGDSFQRFVRSLAKYEQAVLIAAIEYVLQVRGPDICASEWGKPLGSGLYEFRVRKSLRTIMENAGVEIPQGAHHGRPVQIRLFCTFHGQKIILIHHGYDKKADPSKKRQQREIARARTIHKRWKSRRRN